MPTISTEAGACDVREATPEEGLQILDRAARRRLGISGLDFLKRWDAGEYDDSENPALSAVAVLIPFAR